MPLKSVTQFSNKEYYAARDALLEEETTSLQPTEGQPAPAPEVDPTLDAAPEVDGNFVRGLKGGVDNMQALGGGLKALAGSVVGNEEMVAEGMEYYQEQTAEAEQYKPDSTFQEIDSATDFGAWAAYTIGSVVPDLVGMVGTAGAGGLLAKSAVKQGVTEMAETLSKQATERLIKEGIEDQAAEKIARNMADKFAKDKIKKMTTRGATAGAFTYGTQQGASSTFARTLEETGEEAPLAAAVSGLTVGALNALPAFSALTKFLPKGKVDEAGEFISGVVNDKPAWVGEFVKDVTTQMGVESGTEALQLIVEEEIISFVNNNYTENESREYFDYISNERKRSSLIEASAAGFLFGGGTGVVGAGVKGATGGYNSKANLGDDAKIVRTRSMNDPEFAGRIRQMYDEARTNAANGVRSIPLGDQSFLDDNPPLTNAERREAGLTELTNYDGTDMDIPDSGPDVDVPAVASVAVDQENSEFGENTLPPSPQSPQADIVTDFPASTATGATKVRKGIRQFGHEHTFDASMSPQTKPIQDQLIEIAVAANTPEALDPTNTDTVVEAIDMDDIERVFSRNQEFAIKLESGERADLPTIQEAYGDKSAEMETLTAGVMADLSANGLPRSFVDAVSGVFVHKQSQVTSPAITGNTTNGISINADLLGKALTEQDSLSELGWTLAHEVYHAADNSFNLSAADPSLDIRVDEMGEDPSVFMGEVMQEIFENWTKATDVGRRFDYPFNDLNDEILDTSKDNGEINRRYQKEVFAQLGAFFHSNPKQLKAEAPLAYNYIKGIRDKNLQTAETVEAQDEVIQSTSPADTSQPEGISGEVRAPPESGVIEGIQPDAVGRDSETSARSEPADTGVARPQQDGTGQRERRDVQEREVTTEQPRTEVELKATNKKPTFKKADNWEDTGEQIITFDDGDRYTVYFDEDSAESGEEQWYTSADGTFTGAEAMLGETKAETITALQEHRQKLLDAGEKSYNTPLDPQVGGDTTFKAWDFISDKGQVTEKQLRAKFKRLEDNQFDNLVEGLLGETDPESVITLEDGKFLSYEYVQERDLDALQSDLDDTDFIKKSDLSPMAQEITASDVLYGNESLDIVGTSRNGATVVVDLGRAFDDRVRKATGGRNLGDQTPENAAIVSDLIAHEAVQAMKTDGNAGEWYQEKVANAMSIAAKEFPELEADANAKFAFTSIMAITSNGASVPDNSVNTFEIYQEYRDSKVFPDFGVGVTSEAMKNAFALLNRLIEQNGIDSTRQFMDVDVTVKELKDSFGLAVSGELMGTELKGSAIIGPKIGGGFYQNLNGNFDPLTMDRWFMRTWGRLTGTLMADAERKLPVQMAKFREVALGDEYRSKLKKDGINRSQLTKDDEYAKAYGIKVQSAYANGGFKDKSAINKAANNFKNSQGEKQAPQNGKEREYIRSVMRMALDKVNETSGQAPVNMGALQAIIWYPEKDLYKQLGVGNAKSEPTDYETEFKKIVESRSQRGSGVSGSDGSAQQSGAGRLERADGQNDQDAGQSTSRPNQQSNAEADQLNAPPRRNPQRMAQAKAQGFDTDRVLYHGTPQGSDFSAFDYKYTGQGNDQYGAGFYLTDSSGQANGYAGAGIQGESNTVIPVYTKNTNLLKVDGKKVSNLGEAIELDADQIRQILEKAEPLNRGVNDEDMNPFGDRYESFWDNGPEQWMFDQLAQDQEGRNPDELVDFFDGDMQGYLTALSDVTGYDGLELQFGDGLVNQVHWKPENIRSVNAQFDPAKAQSDDLLASPPRRPSDTDFVTAPTSTAAEIMSDDDLIASVRTGTTSGGESGIPSSGIKKWLQKNFSSRGLLPETAFDSMIQRDGEFGAVELDIRQMVGIYDNAVVENFGNIDGQQRAVLDDAMKRPAAEIEKTSLPRNIKDSLIAMRGYIDSLSTQYAQVLNNDIETLKAQGNDEATAKSELLSIVVNNMGTYANRSYQAFNNKDWNKEVPEEVVLAARNLLVEQGTVNPDQVINTILKEGTAYDDMASFISESKLGAKDLAILTKRKQIAPEIRALLGEYKDPRVNFANSASKMSRLIYNDRFLKEVLASGNGVFLFDQESAPADATKKIAEVGSKTLSPLNGMYTYPEVEQAFKDALGKEEMGDLYRTIIKVNGLVKYGKTVIAPTTMARNFMSASLFTVANGHFNWSKLSKSAEVSGSYFSGIGDGIEYLKNLKKLGVVHDSPYAGEMIAYLQDANAEGILDQRDPSAILDTKDAALSLGKRVAQGFTKAYQFGDDFWKIVGFENEVMSFMENKGMSREEAEPLAAKRIRDTYPTYSLIGKIPQQLRRFPLVGTFVSFPAEIVRTQANMIKYLREDLADPDMRPAALKRITGMAMMSAGVYAAQAMAMSAFGVSEEEEEAIKLMAAPWAKNSNILVTGRDDEGRLEYLDLTHLDPYALMKRPLNALMRDQPIDDALIDASAEILKPFLGWDISTNTILEFISNEKSSGGEVYNDADTFINKSIATYMHFERGMGPSFLQNARRIEKAMGGEVSKSGKAYDMGDEMGALVGFRKTTFDPKTALHFKAYEFSEGKRQSTKLLTSVFRDPNDVSDSDIREAFGRASTARKETFNDMAALVNAAMASGLNATQAMTVLRSNGVTKKDARALIDGGASAWTMSDSTLKNSIVKSDILFGQQKSQEFKDRWTLIQQLLKEES